VKSSWILASCFGVVLAAGPLLSATAVLAHGSASGVVKERMDMMKAMQDAMKKLRPLMDAPQVDKSVAGPLAEKIATLLPRIVTHFPPGSGAPPSEALPAVWQNWQTFSDAAQHGADKAKGLVDAIEIGDGSQALRAYAHLAKTCKDCHSDFKAD
jgi:cytochrome c556